VHGALVMAAFGLGTLPNLLALSAWFSHVARRAQGRLARALVAAVLALAGMAGIAAAAHPAAVSAAGSWCMQIPGIGALFGAGG
ncbi:MAG TPA: sulfite exporter TauE/SafE family protein, partial [Burkholderiales bacterium]|nr:sulfite exporter TauE/SafE family protein [Burkholderiales bacterium]